MTTMFWSLLYKKKTIKLPDVEITLYKCMPPDEDISHVSGFTPLTHTQICPLTLATFFPLNHFNIGPERNIVVSWFLRHAIAHLEIDFESEILISSPFWHLAFSCTKSAQIEPEKKTGSSFYKICKSSNIKFVSLLPISSAHILPAQIILNSFPSRISFFNHSD